MAKRQRQEQLLNDRQRRTILMLADSYGLEAIAERFGFSLAEAREAVRSCRDWARSEEKEAPQVEWGAEYRIWLRHEVIRQIG
ncbi:hypothetical protein [Rhizobium leguminosarum]|uniref:hypothetical protein n=1 Tax=Rhizobium leguminosarum TaxID=384 RepID=UPI0015DB4151|nr:hypothetical protein [Rhizobium leguminosarum]NZD54186.1 hypothetical protein [Rhizobium leguminosarum]